VKLASDNHHQQLNQRTPVL